MSSQQSNLTTETQVLVTSNPRVFTTALKKSSDEEEGAPAYVRAKKNKRPQIVGDYLVTLMKIANNDRFHVPTRVAKLNEWAKTFRTGFPRKNNQEFVGKWTPVLVAAAEAMANQLIQIEKAKTGRSDVGQIDGPDQKKLKDASMADLAPEAKAVAEK